MLRPVCTMLAALAATLITCAQTQAQAQSIRKPQAIDRAMLQRIAASQPVDRRTRVYIVEMAAKPAASYEGGVAGLAKSAPEAGQRYNARTSQAQMYAARLGTQQNALLAKVGASGRMLYSYRHTFNGFAARLTKAEAAKLRKDKSVLNVWADRAFKPDTNNSVRFLGLNNENKGLRAKRGLRGAGVIVGMVDTGAVQEHPSFDDTGMAPPPAHWAGICQPGEGWDADDCNNKLIGARFFSAGFLAGAAFDDLAVPGEFNSPRDSDGHGTHTASTATGRDGVQVSLLGTVLPAKVSGMAPDAWVAIYKACWTAIDPDLTGCYFSDTTAAIEAAVNDGVDIISYSIGTAAAFNDPTDVAMLLATSSGVFVSRSAGNEGPGAGSTAAGEPWSIAVAASSHNGLAFAHVTRINAPSDVAGDLPSLEGAITKPLAETGELTDDLVAANPIDACAPIGDIGGKIALIQRGNCFFDDKLTNAVNAGASAVIVFTNLLGAAENPKTVMGGDLSFDIPGVMIDNAPGVELLAKLTGGATVNASLLEPGTFIKEPMNGKVMADFSSRGPYPTVPDWIKPDVTAPGVRVLAGHTPEPNTGTGGDFFQYLQGTSMSTPHVAGIAALLIEAHPDWSPAQVKSALMTTTGRHQSMVKEDGVTPADPFDLGAGHIVPNDAVNPGLTYDAGFFDYLAATCGTGTPLVVPDDCTFLEGLGFSLDPTDLNVASIGVAEVVGTKTIHRTVTNVGSKKATYTAGRIAPPGFRVEIHPETLTLMPGESKPYQVTFTNRNAPPDEWRFGRIVWRDGTGPGKGHVVRSPIALKAKLITAPDAISGEGADGMASFEVGFGYDGAYTAGVHGLVDPFVFHWDAVPDDPDNTFDFGGGVGEDGFFLPIAPGTAYIQWSMFDAYVDGSHDFDLWVFHCPADLSLPCTLEGVSAGATSEETVGINFPIADDPTSPDDGYIFLFHAFETEGQAPANIWTFDWTDPGAAGDAGNMTVTAPSSASVGATGTVDVAWSGLNTGPGAKQVGAISHNDASGPLDLTSLNIANDAGAGYAELCTALPGSCPP